MKRKLKCHVVGCSNECKNAYCGPFMTEYFCDGHFTEFGKDLSDLEPWRQGLTKKEARELINSCPLIVSPGSAFGIQLPASTGEQKEFLTNLDICCQCGGVLNMGWVCQKCGVDHVQHMRRIVQEQSKGKK